MHRKQMRNDQGRYLLRTKMRADVLIMRPCLLRKCADLGLCSDSIISQTRYEAGALELHQCGPKARDSIEEPTTKIVAIKPTTAIGPRTSSKTMDEQNCGMKLMEPEAGL